MMKFKRIAAHWMITGMMTAVFFSIVVASAWGKPPTYTLDALFRLALDQSEAVKLAAETLYVAEQDKKRALSVLIPRFSAFGEYTRYSEEKYLGETPLQPEWSTAYGLRIDQSFTLNGKELIALEVSKAAIEKERLSLAANRETLLIRVAEAYYQVLKAEKAVDIADANVKRLQTYKDAVETRLKLGAVTKTDLYRASAELSGAISDQIRAANILRLTESVLTRVAGVPRPFHLAAPDLFPDFFPQFDLAGLNREALTNRTDLRALELTQKMADDQVQYTRSAWWPQIGIEGVWARQDADPGALTPIEDRLWAKIGLQFSIFDGGLRRAELNQSRSMNRQAELGVSALKKQIAVEVDEAFFDFITRKNTITALADQLTFARENLKAVTHQFDFGLANSVDVVDANTLQVTAERRLAEAVFDSHLAVLKIERATGQLLNNVQTRLELKESN